MKLLQMSHAVVSSTCEVVVYDLEEAEQHAETACNKHDVEECNCVVVKL